MCGARIRSHVWGKGVGQGYRAGAVVGIQSHVWGGGVGQEPMVNVWGRDTEQGVGQGACNSP